MDRLRKSRPQEETNTGMVINFEKRGCVRFEQFDKVTDLIENGPVILKEAIRQ